MSKPENGRRQPIQIYIPRHRRIAQEQQQQQKPLESSTMTNGRDYNESNNNNEQYSQMTREETSPPIEVVRRGRGQFRAPISNNNNTVNRDNHWNGAAQSHSNNNINSCSIQPTNGGSSVSPSIQNRYSRPNQPSSPLLSSPNNITHRGSAASIWASTRDNSRHEQQQENERRGNDNVDQLTVNMERLNVGIENDNCRAQHQKYSSSSSRKGSNTSSSSTNSSNNNNGEESEREEWEDLLETLDKEDEAGQNKRQQPKHDPIIVSEKKSLDARPSPNDYTNILDCYGFPSSFKSFHLQSIFNKYENAQGGYKIKWMDDTRALIIFAHSNTAKRAYLDNLNNFQIKIRPYTGAIEFSESPEGQPIPRRPATTDMVARRLVHGALGVRGPARTPEQRQAERALLQAERDRREAKRRMEAERAKAISDAFNE